MKLRIHKNSIRLRLSQQEVDTIGQGSSIIEMVEMGMGKENNFSYSLIPLDHLDEISAQYVQNNLKISVPTQKAKEWADTEMVSISNGTDNNLSILIEKDFQCLHVRPGEDDSDNFPNPDAQQYSN